MIFDGHDLNSLFVVSRPTFETFAPNRSFQDVLGRDGTVYMGGSLIGGNISVKLSVIRKTPAQRREDLSTLFMWLDVDEPKWLVMDDQPGISYKAIPSGDMPIDSFTNADSVVVNFRLLEAAAYGDTVTVTVPSGGSLTFTVGGTYPTKPTITASAARDGSSQVWGLKLDNGAFLHVATGSASARDVVLDCENRTLTIQGAVALLTLDSDWFELAPGTHTLVMDKGTGAATVTYKERWL